MFFRRREGILRSWQYKIRFYKFIQQGKLAGVRRMVQNGTDPAETGPLFCAYAANQFGVADYLISLGAVVGIDEAIAKDDLELVQQMWNALASNKKSEPVLTAAGLGRDTILEWLLQNGGEVEAQNKDGKTALMIAIRRGCLSTIQLLLQHGADLYYQTDGMLAFWAFLPERGQETDAEQLASFELLLTMGIDLNRRSKIGITLLMSAAMEAPDWISRLVSSGADIHLIHSSGWTSLYFAIQVSSYKGVVELLRHGADPNGIGADNALPLLWAIGRLDMVKALLAAGADVHIRDGMGNTALHYAASQGYYESVVELLKHGADPDVVSRYRETALSLAKANAHQEIVDLLSAHQPPAESAHV